MYLNSLPLLELGTNLPRPSPGEVLSFFGVSPVNYSDSDSERMILKSMTSHHEIAEKLINTRTIHLSHEGPRGRQ